MTHPESPNEVAVNVVRSAVDELRLPDAARSAIAQRLRQGPAGATTLRRAPSPRRRHIGWIAAAATAVLAALWLAPAIDRRTTVSAAEILGRSQQALGAPIDGVESLTYDLQLGGVLEELLPLDQAGRFTVEELIDHDHPGRYRILKVGAAGQLAAAVAADPAAGTHAWYFVADGHGHLLRFPAPKPASLSPAGLRTFTLQTLIGAMQGSGAPALREIDRGGQPAYAIEVTSAAAPPGMLALDHAHAVVARADFGLLDFDAAGSIAGKPFTIAFNLRNSSIRPTAAADAFSLRARPGDEVIDVPAATPAALLDLFGRCLRQ